MQLASGMGPDLPDIILAQLHKHEMAHPVLYCWSPLSLESRVLRRVALIVGAVHQHALTSIQVAGILQLHHDLRMHRATAYCETDPDPSLAAHNDATAAMWMFSYQEQTFDEMNLLELE